MTNQLILKISVANPVKSSKETDEVYKTIENSIEGAQTFRLDRSKVTAAAIEFISILTATGAIAEIASLLYTIWKDHRDKGSLYVSVDSPKIEIMISSKTTEIEIEEFQRKINKFVESGQITDFDKEILEEIKHRRIWIKTK